MLLEWFEFSTKSLKAEKLYLGLRYNLSVSRIDKRVVHMLVKDILAMDSASETPVPESSIADSTFQTTCDATRSLDWQHPKSFNGTVYFDIDTLARTGDWVSGWKTMQMHASLFSFQSLTGNMQGFNLEHRECTDDQIRSLEGRSL